MSNVVATASLGKPSTTITRLLYKIQVDPDTGCWIWQGSKSRIGYGMIIVNKRTTSPHRVSYQYFIGEIPDGKEVHHKCYVRSCCNPLHLDVVSHRENLIDAFLDVRTSDSCQNGHPYTEGNTRIGKRGNRTCRACGREVARRFRERNPEAAREHRKRWYDKQKEQA